VTLSGQFADVATFTGTIGTVAGFTADPSTGALRLLPLSPFDTGGSGSTNVATDSFGMLLFVSDEASNDVSIFRIDAHYGAFALVRTVATEVNPDFLAVVPGLMLNYRHRRRQRCALSRIQIR